MRRIRRNSKVSLGLAAVPFLMLLGALVWPTFLGTHNLPLNVTADNYAQVSDFAVLNAAYSLAGGRNATSYKGVTLHAIATDDAYGLEYFAYRVKPRMIRGAARSAPRALPPRTTATRPGQLSLPRGKLLSEVSVDVCADGKACQEIVVASRGVGNKCWYERQTVGNRSIASSEDARIGYEYQVSSVPVCKASNAPRSGWRPGPPSPGTGSEYQ